MDLFDLFAKISIDISDFESGIDQAQKKFKSFSDNVSGLSGKIDSVYKGMGDVLQPAVDGFKAVESVGKKAGNAVTTGLKGFAAASAAVGGFGAAAVNSGMQFDAAMSEVSAISGATGEDFDALRAKALQMAADTKFGASEVASAYKYMGMAGWEAADMMAGISGVLNLAAASGEDLARTSDIVTDAMSAFRVDQKGFTEDGINNVTHFADVLAAASTSANTDVGMMGETFKYVGTAAGTLEYSIEDVAFAIGLAANNGIKATQAGTSLRSIFNRLSTNTGETKTQMGALSVMTKVLGVEFYKTDGTARDLNSVLMESREAWKGLTVEQQQYYAKLIAGEEAAGAWKAIMNSTDESIEKVTKSIYNCNGAAETMSNTMMDNLAGDITKMKSAFESLQIAISDSLTPTLREFAQFGQKAMAELLEGFQGGGVSGFMDALSGLVTEGVTMLAEKAPEFASVSLQFIQALADGILGADVEILEAVDSVLYMLISGFGTWLSTNSGRLITVGHDLIAILISSFRSAGGIIAENIGDFVPLIADAFGAYHEALFTVGLDILGAIGQGLVENKDEVQNWASLTIERMVTSLRDNAPMIIEGGLALLEALVGAIEENLPLIIETGAEIIGRLVEGISTASPGVQAIIATAVLPHILKIVDTVGKIGGVFTQVTELITGGQGIGKILNIGKTLMGGISKLFGLIAANPVVAIVTGIIAVVVLLYTKCEWFRDAVHAVIDAVAGFFQGAWDLIVSVWNAAGEFFGGIVDGIKSVFDGIGEFLGNLFKAAWEAVQGAWGAAVEFFSGIWEGIQNVFSVVADVLGGFFSAAWDAITAVWDLATGFFSGISDGIHAAFDAVTSFLGDAFSAAWDTITGVWDAAVGFFSGIWDGISGVFSAVSNWFGDKFSAAWDAVTSAWDGVTDFFGGVWDNIKGVFSNAWEAFSDIGGNIIKGIWDGISGLGGWLWDKVSGFFGGFVDHVKGFFGIHSPSTVFAGIGENMVAGMEEGIGDKSGDVDSELEKMAQGMIEAFGGLADQYGQIGKVALDTMADAFSVAPQMFMDIGQNAVNALSGGLGATITKLQNRVAGLMNGITAAAKAALGIHSPSKVFAGIGENMALGLGEGWNDEYTDIKRKIESGLNFKTVSVGVSANGIGYGAAGNAQDGTRMGANGFGGTTVNIYSPEAVDAVTATRVWKKEMQKMALGYV